MTQTDNILAKLHLEALNDMQKGMAEAMLHTADNLMLLSPTGTGKTLAYLLPLVEMLDAASPEVQAVVIVPGRELALQSSMVLRNMGTSLRSQACYGGRATMDEHRMMRQLQPQILFGTPGRLNDHIDKNNFKTSGVRYIIIDEFDKCLEMGFHNEMQKLIERLPKTARQILLSATPAEEMREQHILNDHFHTLDYLPEHHQVTQRVTIFAVSSPEKDKLRSLRQLLITLGEGQSMVFVNYRESVERVSDYLTEHGFVVSAYHGGLEQKQREAALGIFSNGSANILVSTDLASRGLDIPAVDNIIHYHLPESKEAYIHRVGRTARWQSRGRSFFLLAPDERIPDYVEADVQPFAIDKAAAEVPKPKFSTLYIGKGKKDKISRGDIVGFLCKKAGLQAVEIGAVDVRDYYSYAAIPRLKMAQVLRLANGQKIKGLKTVFEQIK